MFPEEDDDVIDCKATSAEGEGDDNGVSAASDRLGEAEGGVAVELDGLDPVLEKLKVRVLTCPGGRFPVNDATKEFFEYPSVESSKWNAREDDPPMSFFDVCCC